MPPSATYRNFDLLITRAADRYRALAVDAPSDADIFFDLPPSLPDFASLRSSPTTSRPTTASA